MSRDIPAVVPLAGVSTPTVTPDTPNTFDIVRLVLGVSRLGENDLRGWWQGHALDRTGQYVLSGMFRRTWRSAALEIDISAAVRVHDELLGRSTALHLFSDSLPYRRWAAAWLGEQKTTDDPSDLVRTMETWTAEQAVSAVRGWCGPVAPRHVEPLGNGLLIGRLSSGDLADPAVLAQTARLLCSAYLEQDGALRPPYFDLAR